MRIITPFSKEIKFDRKIFEICSISLEHEFNYGDDISGNFLISGEYITHEVSVNKETFNYKLPFNLELTDNIDKSSLNFEITDFSYELINNDTLKVDIEFLVNANEIEVEEERVIEPIDIDELFSESEEIKEELEDISEERLDEDATNIIVDSEKVDEYTTYNIHIVKETDTIESIIETYKTDIDTIKNYNQFDNLNIGDKIIIPCLDE